MPPSGHQTGSPPPKVVAIVNTLLLSLAPCTSPRERAASVGAQGRSRQQRAPHRPRICSFCGPSGPESLCTALAPRSRSGLYNHTLRKPGGERGEPFFLDSICQKSLVPVNKRPTRQGRGGVSDPLLVGGGGCGPLQERYLNLNFCPSSWKCRAVKGTRSPLGVDQGRGDGRKLMNPWGGGWGVRRISLRRSLS